MEVIEKCSCTSACYRASLMEQVYDYSLTESTDEDPDPDNSGPKTKVGCRNGCKTTSLNIFIPFLFAGN